MNRGNRVLVAILVVQVALAVVVFWPRGPAVAAGEPLFAGLEADQIVRLTIRDREGQEVQLAQGAEGWVLPEAGDYPVKEGAVPELLDKIVALKSGRLVAETRDSQVRLQVFGEDYAHLVEFELQDGTVHRLYLGTSPSYSAIHVRAEDQDEVYLVSDLSSSDVAARLSTWIDTLYFTVPQDQIVAFSLENGNGYFEFEKSDEEWTMAGLASDETLDANAITSLVSRASSVRMLRPLGVEAKEEYRLQAPNAVLVLHAKGEEGTQTTYMLHVGAKSEEDNSYVLKSSESPYYVRVAEYTAQDWVEKTREGFLEQPPTPEPTTTPAE